jgi:hypothetical protein
VVAAFRPLAPNLPGVLTSRSARPVGADAQLRRSSFLAAASDGVMAVTLPLLATRVTSDPLAIAAVIAVQHLPWVLVALGGRSLAGDRRTWVGLVNTLRALVSGYLFVMTIVGRESIELIQLTALVVGLGEAMTDHTEAQTDDTSGLSSRGMAAMGFIGLPLGGFLYELYPAAPLVVDMLLFTVASLFALCARPVPLAARRVDPVDPAERTSRPSGALLACAATASLAASVVAGLLVLFAHDDLALGAPAFGLLLAGLAAATALGGWLAPTVGGALGLRAGMAVALVVAGTGQLIAAQVAHVDQPWFAAIALGLAAGSAMVATVLGRARYQLAVGPFDGTRALHQLHLVVWTAIPIGALVAGWAARDRSVPDVIAVGAVAWIVAAALAAATSGSATRQNRLTASDQAWFGAVGPPTAGDDARDHGQPARGRLEVKEEV